MKKLFTSLILLMGVMIVQAQVYVAGFSVDPGSSSSNVKSGTAALSSDGKTLTLTNAVIEPSGTYNGINNKGVAGLKIVIKGTCSIKGKGRGIITNANTTISGEGGSLTVDVSENTDNYGCIKVENGATLTVEWINLTCKGKSFGIDGTGTETLNLLCCEVNVSTTGSGSCIQQFASLSKNANYWFNGETWNSTDKKLYKSNGSSNATSCYLAANLKVGMFNVNSNSTWNFLGGSDGGLTAGSIKYESSTKTLTFDGATFKAPTNVCVVQNNNVDGLIIKLAGKNTLSLSYASSGSAFRFSKSTTIEGAGYTSSYKNTITAYLPIYQYSSGTLTINNAYLELNGKNYGMTGGSSASGKSLIIKKSYVSVSNTSDFETASIAAFEKCELTDCNVDASVASGICYRSSLKGFGDNSGNLYKKKILINVPSTTYSLWVAGTQVSNLNASNVVVDGMTAGKISYNNSSRTLTLNNVTLKTTASGVIGISVGSSLSGDLTVNITGENSITSADDAFYMNKNTTFSGDGKAEFISTAESGLSGAGGACPTFTLLKPILFKGKKYGYWGTGSSNEVMTIKKTDSGGFVRFSGETAAIHNLTDLTLNNVDFVSQAGSTENLLGCYFDSEKKKVMQNGGVVAKGAGKFVAFGYVSERYDLYVGEVQVNDRNAAGIGSPNITAGGGTAAVYDATNKKLTLNGAKIEATNGTYGNCIRVSSSFDGNFTLNVAGNSTLTSDVSGKSCFYIESKKAPTTITGSGKLTIGGSTTNGIVSWPKLTLDNVEMEMANSLSGSSDVPSLTVKLTTAGRKVTVNGVVNYWGDVLLSGGTKVVNPGDWEFRNSSSLEKKAWGIYSKSTNALASPVVFGDQTAAGIEGIVADPNAEVIGIFDAQGRRLEEMQPGINILRMSDGTTRKVIKK